MWKLAIPLLFLALYGCGLFHKAENHTYHNMPPPLALYFDNGIRHLSFSAKLALLDRVDYMNANPKLKAEITSHADATQASQLAHIVGQEFLDQGISSQRLKITPITSGERTNVRPYVAVRLKGAGS